MPDKKKTVATLAVFLASFIVAGCHHARPCRGTIYRCSRYENKAIAIFLQDTLDRDLRWGDGNREVRLRREAEDRRFARLVSTPKMPEVVSDDLEVHEVMDRLYGARPCQ
jgi:hypothetical protein